MLTPDRAHARPLDAQHELAVAPVGAGVSNSVVPLELVLAIPMTGISGQTEAFDNNFGSVYNAKADWDARGTLPAQHIGKPILGLRYHFANTPPNEYKKSKTLELWYFNGATWVHHTTLNCKYPVAPWPSFEDFDLFSNPLPNPTGLVRIIGRGSWDQYSYRWVSECRFLVFI